MLTEAGRATSVCFGDIKAENSVYLRYYQNSVSANPCSWYFWNLPFLFLEIKAAPTVNISIYKYSLIPVQEHPEDKFQNVDLLSQMNCACKILVILILCF